MFNQSWTGGGPTAGQAGPQTGLEPVTPTEPVPWPDRFQLKRELGHGGMGTVYLAYDRQEGLEVAVKVLKGVRPEDRLLLKREFRALSGIVHPNLVDLYELVISESLSFFAMEYVRGVDFVAEVQRILAAVGDREARFRQIRDLCLQLAQAISALHGGGKLHRDIKPSNVLVTDSGRVVLLDFGLTSALATGEDSDGQIVGTFPYMAPELFLDGQEVSFPADWYAFGLTIRESLTCWQPSRSDMFASGKPTLASQGFDIPEDLDTLISELTAIDASARPSGSEIVGRLGGRVVEETGWASIPPPSSNNWVGRGGLLGQLRTALEELPASGVRIVRVHGPSGIGKSALLRQFLGQQQPTPDVLSLKARCHPQEALAYNAMDGLVDDLSRLLIDYELTPTVALEPQQVAALIQVFPVLAKALQLESPVLDERASDRERRISAASAIRQVLHCIAAGRRLVIWLDDVQWGDSDSGILIKSIVREEGNAATLLVLSYRSEEELHSPCLRELRADDDLWSQTLELQVGPLSVEESTELLSRATAVPIDDELLRSSLVASAAGSPFFLSEFARHVSVRPQAALHPIGLDGILEARLEGISQPSRRVLELLAVAGAAIEGETLRVATALPLSLRGLLIDLERRLLVRTVDLTTRKIEFYHDKLREAVLAKIPVLTRQKHHLAIARAVLSSSSPNLLVAVEHFEAAGDLDGVRRYVVPAANQALKALAFERAARLVQRAIELKPGEVSVHELYRRLGSALGSAGHGREAAEAFTDAARILAQESDTNSEEVTWLRQAAAEQYIQTGYYTEGTDMMRSVLGALGIHLPTTKGRALGMANLLRLESIIRGVKPARRNAPASPAELRRFDALWGVNVRLSIIDYALCNYSTIRCVREALRLGDASRICRALALEAAYCSLFPQKIFQKRAVMLLQEARAVAPVEPYDIAIRVSMEAVVAFYSGRYQETWRKSDEAISILPPGRAGETGPFEKWSLVGLGLSGELKELIRRVTVLRQSAVRLGDRFTEQNVSLGIPAVAWLALDEPEVTRVQADRALSWAPAHYTVQHYQHYTTLVDCDLYVGAPFDAWRRTLDTWPSHKREYFLALKFVRGDLWQARGRSALAAATALLRSGQPTGPAGESVDHLLAMVRGAIAELRKFQELSDLGFAEMLEAGLCRINGGAAPAVERLRSASHAFDRAGMRMHAVIADYWIERIDSFADAPAEAWLAAQGVRNIPRFAAMYAPGLDWTPETAAGRVSRGATRDLAGLPPRY